MSELVTHEIWTEIGQPLPGILLAEVVRGLREALDAANATARLDRRSGAFGRAWSQLNVRLVAHKWEGRLHTLVGEKIRFVIVELEANVPHGWLLNLDDVPYAGWKCCSCEKKNI